MPPRKLIHKSRPLGGKPRSSTPASERKTRKPREPKSDSKAKVDPLAVAASLVAPSNGASTAVASNGSTSTTPKQSQTYTGISQVNHGLSLPSFDVNSYFAGDLFSDSSPLPRTTKEKADEMIASIEEKRQTIKVVTANIGLNQDVVRAGNEYLKLEGLAIDYATTGVNNETKYIGYQTAEVNRDIAINRFDQAQERLVQGQKTLAGMQSITPLIDEEWEARKSLKQSQISSLKIEATKAKEALEPKLLQLSQNFRQELEDLN